MRRLWSGTVGRDRWEKWQTTPSQRLLSGEVSTWEGEKICLVNGRAATREDLDRLRGSTEPGADEARREMGL